MIKRIPELLLVGYFGACAMALVGLGWLFEQDQIAPEQPIAFSHERHVGQSKLKCDHCHRYAELGSRATVPAMSVCGECHGAMETDNPQILALQEYLSDGRPVPWVKVYQLPWHVRFTHKRHRKVGIECATCHGQVEGMGYPLRRTRSLEMGWCVNCHRMKDAPTDCLTCHK